MITKKLSLLSLLFVLFCFAAVPASHAKDFPVLTEFPKYNFLLKNVASGKYLTTFKGKLVVHGTYGLTGQNWTFPGILSDGRGYVIQNKKEGIGATGGKTGNFKDEQVIVSDKSKKLVSFVMLNDSTFVIKLVDDLVLHEKGGEKKKKDGTGVIWYPYTGSKNQQWQIVFIENKKETIFKASIPAKKKIDVPQPAIPEFFVKNKKFEYSASGNYVHYKAKGTAEVTKVEGNVAYVTINIIEAESEGPNGIEKKGKSTYETKFTRKGDNYYMDEEKSADMAPSGKVDPSGLLLDLTSEGGSKIFKVTK
jgi:hypothetical protein